MINGPQSTQWWNCSVVAGEPYVIIQTVKTYVGLGSTVPDMLIPFTKCQWRPISVVYSQGWRESEESPFYLVGPIFTKKLGYGEVMWIMAPQYHRMKKILFCITKLCKERGGVTWHWVVTLEWIFLFLHSPIAFCFLRIDPGATAHISLDYRLLPHPDLFTLAFPLLFSGLLISKELITMFILLSVSLMPILHHKLLKGTDTCLFCSLLWSCGSGLCHKIHAQKQCPLNDSDTIKNLRKMGLICKSEVLFYFYWLYLFKWL